MKNIIIKMQIMIADQQVFFSLEFVFYDDGGEGGVYRSSTSNSFSILISSCFWKFSKQLCEKWCFADGMQRNFTVGILHFSKFFLKILPPIMHCGFHIARANFNNPFVIDVSVFHQSCIVYNTASLYAFLH